MATRASGMTPDIELDCILASLNLQEHLQTSSTENGTGALRATPIHENLKSYLVDHCLLWATWAIPTPEPDPLAPHPSGPSHPSLHTSRLLSE